MSHEDYMREAILLADDAAALDEVPVGALVMRGDLRMGQGYNRNIQDHDPSAHAEVLALREACAYLSNHRLPETTLYVSLEPCLMCYTAIVHARVGTLVYGAPDPKNGFSFFLDDADLDRFNHRPEIVAGVLAEEASAQIRDFFREKRERGKRKWMRDKGKI